MSLPESALDTEFKSLCKQADIELITSFLDANFDGLNHSPFRLAALSGNKEVFEFVRLHLIKDPDYDYVFDDLWDFRMACMDNELDAVKAYIDLGYIEKSKGEHMFRTAFNNEAFEAADLLLDAGADIDEEPYLLHSFIITEIDLYRNWQAEGCEIEAESAYLKYLVSKGVDVNRPLVDKGRTVTPLDLALEGPHDYAVRLLTQHGAQRFSELSKATPSS